MPDRETMARLREDQREGKSPSTQAGEFVRETIEHVRAGKHGVRSTKQLIAIGLSKARRAGVKLPAPRKGTVPEATRQQAKRELDSGAGNGSAKPGSTKRSRATLRALRREGRSAANPNALSRHARQSARERTKAQRSSSARAGARTRQSRRSQ